MFVFWLMIAVLGVFAWFLLAPTFKLIGEYFALLFKNAKKQMTDEKENDK